MGCLLILEGVLKFMRFLRKFTVLLFLLCGAGVFAQGSVSLESDVAREVVELLKTKDQTLAQRRAFDLLDEDQQFSVYDRKWMLGEIKKISLKTQTEKKVREKVLTFSDLREEFKFYGFGVHARLDGVLGIEGSRDELRLQLLERLIAQEKKYDDPTKYKMIMFLKKEMDVDRKIKIDKFYELFFDALTTVKNEGLNKSLSWHLFQGMNREDHLSYLTSLRYMNANKEAKKYSSRFFMVLFPLTMLFSYLGNHDIHPEFSNWYGVGTYVSGVFSLFSAMFYGLMVDVDVFKKEMQNIVHRKALDLFIRSKDLITEEARLSMAEYFYNNDEKDKARELLQSIKSFALLKIFSDQKFVNTHVDLKALDRSPPEALSAGLTFRDVLVMLGPKEILDYIYKHAPSASEAGLVLMAKYVLSVGEEVQALNILKRIEQGENLKQFSKYPHLLSQVLPNHKAFAEKTFWDGWGEKGELTLLDWAELQKKKTGFELLIKTINESLGLTPKYVLEHYNSKYAMLDKLGYFSTGVNGRLKSIYDQEELSFDKLKQMNEQSKISLEKPNSGEMYTSFLPVPVGMFKSVWHKAKTYFGFLPPDWTDSKTVRYQLSKIPGNKINEPLKQTGYSPLEHALMIKDEPLVLDLIKRGSIPTELEIKLAQNVYGEGNTEVVLPLVSLRKHFIELQAISKLSDKIVYVFEKNHLELWPYILSLKPDSDRFDQAEISLVYKRNVEALKRMSQFGWLKNSYGYTEYLAVQNNALEIFKLYAEKKLLKNKPKYEYADDPKTLAFERYNLKNNDGTYPYQEIIKIYEAFELEGKIKKNKNFIKGTQEFVSNTQTTDQKLKTRGIMVGAPKTFEGPPHTTQTLFNGARGSIAENTYAIQYQLPYVTQTPFLPLSDEAPKIKVAPKKYFSPWLNGLRNVLLVWNLTHYHPTNAQENFKKLVYDLPSLQQRLEENNHLNLEKVIHKIEDEFEQMEKEGKTYIFSDLTGIKKVGEHMAIGRELGTLLRAHHKDFNNVSANHGRVKKLELPKEQDLEYRKTFKTRSIHPRGR